MTTRGGFTLNGIHFNQTDSQRAGSPQSFFFLDGKRTSRDAYNEALAGAKAAATAAAAAEARCAAAAEAAKRTTREPAAKATRLSLREAALAVVSVADLSLPPDERADLLARRIAALAAALTKAPARPAAEPREPRGDSKQALVIALLQREGGTTNPDVQAATGWQPHTVRGFFAGLKNKGYAVASAKVEGRGTVYSLAA